ARIGQPRMRRFPALQQDVPPEAQPSRVDYLEEEDVATRTWDKDRASKRIDACIADLPIGDIVIKKFVRETDLTSLPRNVAYRLHGVHLYADILNLADMLQ